MNNDDITLHSYQDDLASDDRPDPFMDELSENPAKNTFGIPDKEFKKELDKQLDDEDEDFMSDDVDSEDDERQATEDINNNVI